MESQIRNFVCTAIALLCATSAAYSQGLTLENSVTYPVQFSSEFKTTITDKSIQHIILQLPEGAAQRSGSYKITLNAVSARAALEITRNVNGVESPPWFADLSQSGRRTPVLDVNDSERRRLKLEQLRARFPGLTLGDVASFYGISIDELLKQLYPNDIPLEATALVRRDACVPATYRMRLIISLRGISDRDREAGVAVLASVSPILSVSARKAIVSNVQNNDARSVLVTTRVGADGRDKLSLSTWSINIPVLERLLGRKVLSRNRRWDRVLYRLSTDRLGASQGTIDRFRDDFSNVESQCVALR